MFKTYPEMVAALIKPSDSILKSLTPEKAHLIHMTLGLCGESGEFLDAVKKHTIYGKPLDLVNAIEELGDIEFYLEGLRVALGLDRDAILQANIKKLSSRYHQGSYSDSQAKERADKQ